jgi:glucosamine kinase
MPAALRSLISSIGIGAAGASASPEGARSVLARLGADLTVPRAIASDVVTAHVGAFGGEAGSLVVAGTGAVGYRMDRDGAVARADGWGVWLGDEGSGRWIGQQGLIAALRAHDGRGPHTSLLAAAGALVGSLERLPPWIAASSAPGKDLGSFAPHVLAQAEAGDAVARAIVRSAVEALTATALAVHDRTLPLCFVGGLVQHPYLAGRLLASLMPHGVRLTTPQGDAVHGAAILASRIGLPHEKQVIREQ